MPSSKGLAVQENAPRRPSVAGTLARDHVAVLMSTIGMRLSRGAMAYYRATWNISTVLMDPTNSGHENVAYSRMAPRSYRKRSLYGE